MHHTCLRPTSPHLDDMKRDIDDIVRDIEDMMRRGGDLIDGTWSHNISLDSGAFIFEGATPKSLDYARIVGNGGSMIWRSTGTPTLVTSGYSLEVNPEAGVGLRVVKN